MTLDDYLNQPGITAAELAVEIGITEASVSRIRKGQQNISRDVIRRIVAATAGAVTAEELVFGHDAADTTDATGLSAGNDGENSRQVAANA